MLKTIECNKFISNKNPRGTLAFFPDLNICLGEDNAKNSIGKSTFLLAVDFCFGGESYLKSTDLLEEVGHHAINFSFEFDEKPFYFSRSTQNPDVVSICNEHFSKIKENTIEEFRNFLLEKYNLLETQMSFRNIVNPYTRIFGLSSCEAKNIVGVEGNKGGKTRVLLELVKLFEKYEIIKNLDEKFVSSQNEEKEYNAIAKSKIVNEGKIKTKTQVKNAKEELLRLENELEEITQKNQIQSEQVDSQKALQIAELKKRLTILRRNRTRLLNEKNLLEIGESETAKISKEDFEQLKEFFPNADFAHLEEIQNFHRQISKIIKKETREEIQKVTEKINENERDIIELTQKLTELSIPLEIPQKILEHYASLSKQKDELENQMDFYAQKQKIQKEAKESEKNFAAAEFEVLKKIAENINEKLETLSGKINGAEKYSPKITINSAKSYSYFSPKDKGTGTAYVNMILYDLAILNLTKLPFIIHDSLLFKNIEDERVVNIFNEYENTKKQIFLSFDKKNSYNNDELVEIIEKHKVIELSFGGNELFGRSWSIKNVPLEN